MGCNCKLVEGILSAVILLITLFGMGMMYYRWVVIIASAALLLHAVTCKKHNKK